MTAATGAWAQTSDKETPLTLQATANGMIYIYNPKEGMHYKVGDDEMQTVTGTDNVAIYVTEGQTVQFFGNGTEINAYGVEQGGGTRFYSTVPCYIYGNIMSLVNETGFAKATVLTADYAFRGLFASFRNLSNHASRKLVLPAMTMTKLCYYGMFEGCTGLTTAPALPATELAEQCYYSMFNGCTSLTTAPALPATELADQCYHSMFNGCTSLTTAPLLPAPSLAQLCYCNMFKDCTNLNAVTCLATNISAEYATDNWLKGVAATGTLTIAKGMEDKWTANSANGIPSGWTTDVYGFKVKLADRTADAGNWTATVGTSTTAEPLPVGGLSKGDAVTLTYGGRLKVKAVTATTDAKPTYLKWDATKKKWVEADIPATAIKVENADGGVTWAAGTYLVEGDVTISGDIELTGNVELIIKDGATLTANRIYGGADNHSLNIYGQANKSGELNVACSSNADAIEALDALNIHSCKVNASSSEDYYGGIYDIGEINVYGGSVDAEYTGSSIGYGMCDAALNIYGGEVKAVGKGNQFDLGYGITEWENSITIKVYGGKLWAENSENAGINYHQVTLTKEEGFSGKIETSEIGIEWTEYTDADTPDAKYVRVGY